MDETMTWELRVQDDVTGVRPPPYGRYPTQLAARIGAREERNRLWALGQRIVFFSTRDTSVPAEQRPGWRPESPGGWEEVKPAKLVKPSQAIPKEDRLPRERFTVVGVCPESYYTSFDVGQRVRFTEAYRKYMQDDRVFTVEKLLNAKINVRAPDGELLRAGPSAFELAPEE